MSIMLNVARNCCCWRAQVFDDRGHDVYLPLLLVQEKWLSCLPATPILIEVRRRVVSRSI